MILMIINVSKDDDGVSLEFRVSAYANVIVIDSVSIKQLQESQNADQGPDFDYVFDSQLFLVSIIYDWIL